MAAANRDRRTDEMLLLALFCARFAEDTDGNGRQPPSELHAVDWTSAFRQFHPSIAGGRDETRFLSSIRRDFEAFSERLADGRPLRPRRTELIEKYSQLSRPAFWKKISRYRNGGQGGTGPSDDPFADVKAHAAEFQDATEREAIVLARVGQGPFRQSLIERWGGCSVTGCGEIAVLRASHIKPWCDSTNEERLDMNNGLLLVPNLDVLFDRGLISFSDTGHILIGDQLSVNSRSILGVDSEMRLRKALPGLSAYLQSALSGSLLS